MKLQTKEWVCLVTEDDLNQRKEAARRRNFSIGGYVTQMLWRQISIVATVDGITVSLMNVDEEAARGGYWRGGTACVDHKFTWEDLCDSEFIAGLFAHEQVVVYTKAVAMLIVLRERMVALREALAAM